MTEELTNKQEDLMLSKEIEQDMKEERDRESDEGRKRTIFDDWKSDNLKQLREDFCAQEDGFDTFCREEFDAWRESQ